MLVSIFRVQNPVAFWDAARLFAGVPDSGIALAQLVTTGARPGPPG